MSQTCFATARMKLRRKRGRKNVKNHFGARQANRDLLIIHKDGAMDPPVNGINIQQSPRYLCHVRNPLSHLGTVGISGSGSQELTSQLPEYLHSICRYLNVRESFSSFTFQYTTFRPWLLIVCLVTVKKSSVFAAEHSLGGLDSSSFSRWRSSLD